MRTAIQTIILFLVVVCICGSARAGAWYVEQDGTGDFLVIQDAVDVAADGDTIFIGPGHYQDMHPVQISGYIFDVIVNWDDTRDLTFIGAGVDAVLLGPDTYSPSSLGPKGIYQQYYGNLHVEGISFQNLYSAIISVGGSQISDCRTTGCRGGVVEFYGSAHVSNCEFLEARATANNVDGFSSPEFLVENCIFYDSKVYFSDGTNFIVRDCTFDGKIGTIYGASGVFSGVQSTIDEQYRLSISGSSNVEIRDSIFDVNPGGTGALYVGGQGSMVNLEGNIFTGGDWATLDFQVSCTVTASGNHFLNPDGDYVVRTDSWSNPDVGSIDLRNNYWGTDDPTEIGHSIYDGYDDPSIEVYVQYSPFSDVPLPTEQKTLGDIKAMYR